MRTRQSLLLLAPILMLATSCADPSPVALLERELVASTSEVDEDSYEVIALDGGNGSAWAINDFGVAVGSARGGSGEDPYPALRWVVTSGGVSQAESLGPLPPPFDDAFSHSPRAVNQTGLIVGHFNDKNRDGAFVYSEASGMQLLPRFVGSTYQFYALDVSDLGIAVGRIEYAVRDEFGTIVDRPKRAAVWVNLDDEPLILPPLAGHDESYAFAINIDGLITGFSRPEEGPSIGVAWEINEEGELMKGPYELEAGFSAWAINNGGDMVGEYPAFCGAALIRAGTVTVLDPLAPGECTRAFGISNAAGDGIVRIAGSSGDRPSLWTVDAAGRVTGPVDLGSERGNRGAYATAVNAKGWVVGGGRTPHGDIPLLWLPMQKGDDNGDDPAPCNHPRGKCK
jgi:hypothetical protein